MYTVIRQTLKQKRTRLLDLKGDYFTRMDERLSLWESKAIWKLSFWFILFNLPFGVAARGVSIDCYDYRGRALCEKLANGNLKCNLSANVNAVNTCKPVANASLRDYCTISLFISFDNKGHFSNHTYVASSKKFKSKIPRVFDIQVVNGNVLRYTKSCFPNCCNNDITVPNPVRYVPRSRVSCYSCSGALTCNPFYKKNCTIPVGHCTVDRPLSPSGGCSLAILSIGRDILFFADTAEVLDNSLPLCKAGQAFIPAGPGTISKYSCTCKGDYCNRVLYT